MSEVWWRNPTSYVRELIECGGNRVIFDLGLLIKRKIDLQKWCDLYFGLGNQYRAILCSPNGPSAEFINGVSQPVAAYSTWVYGDDPSNLEDYCMANPGDDDDLCNDMSIDILERPVAGQENRVIVMNYPDLKTGPGKQFLKLLSELQEENPGVKLHLHGPTSFVSPLRIDLAAYDWEPRTPAQKGTIFLPTGRIVRKNESLVPHARWFTMLGFKPVDMRDGRTRCLYNIKACMWGSDHYNKDFKPASRRTKVPIINGVPDSRYKPVATSRTNVHNGVVPQPGDKFICDQCSLATTCTSYRSGSVCTLPDAETRALYTYFQTRDSDQILDGLSRIMAIGANRLEEAVELEELTGQDPETRKLAEGLFGQGEKLAKLVDPALRNPKVAVQIGDTKNVVLGNPRQLIAHVIRELEAKGFTREQITPEMVNNALAGLTSNVPSAIEGAPGEPAASNVVDLQPVSVETAEPK